MDDAPLPTCLCGSIRLEIVFRYDASPPGESRFPLGASAYHRIVYRCHLCGHFVSLHHMDLSDLYSGEYVDTTYGDADGLRRSFERIASLPPAQSDNAGRVHRILDFAEKHLPASPTRQRTVLDVGSGLCVFLHRMKKAGWEGTALDPDPRAVRHARESVGVRTVQGDLMTVEDLGRFDIVAFNKVLEHVRDPVSMLARSVRFLEQQGAVYLELPDGEAAVEHGPDREEFFIEHFHIFSAASVALLAARAGFQLASLERLHEPSGKYTLRAFLRAEAGEGLCSLPDQSGG